MKTRALYTGIWNTRTSAPYESPLFYFTAALSIHLISSGSIIIFNVYKFRIVHSGRPVSEQIFGSGAHLCNSLSSKVVIYDTPDVDFAGRVYWVSKCQQPIRKRQWIIIVNRNEQLLSIKTTEIVQMIK